MNLISEIHYNYITIKETYKVKPTEKVMKECDILNKQKSLNYETLKGKVIDIII